MTDFLDKISDGTKELYDEISATIASGKDSISTMLGTLPLITSRAQQQNANHSLYDEKHWFLIPNSSQKSGYSLYSTRVLPQGCYEVNDLPKKRIFHVPFPEAESILKDLMIKNFADNSETNSEQSNSSLSKLADEIDKAETKLTGGFLLIGGLVAIFNPLIGIGVALSASVPVIAGTLSKYGLKNTAEWLDKKQIAQKLEETQQEVLKQFEGSETSLTINPVLGQLFNVQQKNTSEKLSLPGINEDEWKYLYLTCQAIIHANPLKQELFGFIKSKTSEEVFIEQLYNFEKKITALFSQEEYQELMGLFVSMRTSKNTEVINTVIELEKNVNVFLMNSIFTNEIDSLNISIDHIQVKNTIYTHIPETIKLYLKVIDSEDNGDKILKALKLISINIANVISSIYANDQQNFEIQMRFLEDKFCEFKL